MRARVQIDNPSGETIRILIAINSKALYFAIIGNCSWKLSNL